MNDDITRDDVLSIRNAADSLERLNGERFGVTESGIIGIDAVRRKTARLRDVADRLESRMTLKL